MFEPDQCHNCINKQYLDKKIIIIGAGISGLSCAVSLKKLGFSNICILEARERVGGRIQTVSFGTHFIEMGAQWIHGEKNNIIYQLSENENLINKNTYNYIEELLKFKNFCPEERDLIISLYEFLEKKLEVYSLQQCLHKSLLDYLYEQFEDYIRINCLFSKYETLCEVFEWHIKILCEVNGCIDLSTVSTHLYNMYQECEGNQCVELKNGYSEILDLFLKDPLWVVKNSKVCQIDWSIFKCHMKNKENKFDNLPSNLEKTPKFVKVTCENGNIYYADHIICTIPLGSLKKYGKSLFLPSLDEPKLNTIECIGFGVVNKVYLEFSNPFWISPAIFNVFWKKEYDEQFVGYFKENKIIQHWVKSVNRFSYTPGHPNMLCAWIVGQGAITVESLSNTCVVKDLMKLISVILNKILPMPINVFKSSWLQDEFSCGSYSFPSVDCYEKKVSFEDLAEPIYSEVPCPKHPVILFAGEATHSYYYSTVHGACETGIREAKRLYQHYRNCELENAFKLLSLNEICLLPSSNKKRFSKNCSVVIVGAGLAGLATALHLTKNGFQNIVLIEADNRVGGRVSTIKYNGQFLELGAQWIHGMHNSLYRFSKEYDLLPALESYSYEGKGVFCTSNGEIISIKVIEEVKKIVQNAKSELERGCYDLTIAKSVKAFLTEYFEDYIKSCPDQINLSLKKSIFDWFIRFEIIDNACDSLENIAVQSFTEWDDCPDEMYHIDFKNGFGSVLDTLLSQIKNVNLLLNTSVTQIKWNSNLKLEEFEYYDTLDIQINPRIKFPVSVECKNGRILNADSVIVTSSIGFLKENLHSFFIPSLPDRKITALNTIGFGTINKFFLIFDKPFWSSVELGFQLLWTERNEHCEKVLKENSWALGITGFDVLPNLPNVLLGWIGGEEAKLFENISEKDIISVCIEILQIFLKRSDIPDPIKLLRSSWYANPFIRGAYSNRTPSYYKSDSTLQDLQHPLCCTYVSKQCKEVSFPIVQFAGEALDKRAFSSAHGAFHSGLRAAESLIKACLDIES